MTLWSFYSRYFSAVPVTQTWTKLRKTLLLLYERIVLLWVKRNQPEAGQLCIRSWQKEITWHSQNVNRDQHCSFWVCGCCLLTLLRRFLYLAVRVRDIVTEKTNMQKKEDQLCILWAMSVTMTPRDQICMGLPTLSELGIPDLLAWIWQCCCISSNCSTVKLACHYEGKIVIEIKDAYVEESSTVLDLKLTKMLLETLFAYFTNRYYEL